MHFMRQTDSLSFVSQYFNNGFHFFDPQLFNLKNIDGRAACEFPILYYLTSILYLILGKKLFLLKFIHLLISFTGLFYVYRLAYLILKDYVYSILIALFLCTSTVFNFYAFNYLPDAPALGFVFIAWYYVFHYQQSGAKSSGIKAFIFFTLSSLIKVTYLINPIAILVFYLFMLLFKKHSFYNQQNPFLLFKYGLISLLLVSSWNAYMLYYNQQYDSHSFNTTILPLWDLTNNDIHLIWSDYVMSYWYNSYFAKSSFHFIAILFLLSLIFIKKSNYNISLINGLLFLGCLCFSILFYAQFKDHDYYFLICIPFITLTLINGMKTLINIDLSEKYHRFFKAVFFLVVFAGINHSRHKLTERYEYSIDEYSQTGLLIDENRNAIDELNIPKDAKIILAPEPSQNGGLFYLDRMGWTINSKEGITKNAIRTFKMKGADFLLLSNQEPSILEVLESEGEIILKNEDIVIYQLK